MSPSPNCSKSSTAVPSRVCRATGGRALVLFTAYTQLRQTAQAIATPLAEDGILVYEQGEGASPHTLLETFRSAEKAVLLGTRAFWEGVDVPGEALSVLVIAKLPDPSVEFDQNDSTVTPGLMTWNILDYNQSAGYVGSPYDFYLSSSSPVVFRFEPIFEFDARNVTTLLVNLDGEYGYSTSPRLWIRNFTTGRWEELASDWGVTRIENPAGYLDQYGGVELRIQAAAGYDTPISRFDVTLLGE